MEEYFDFSRTNEFMAFMNGLSEHPTVHGVFIETHPRWKQWSDFTTLKNSGFYDENVDEHNWITYSIRHGWTDPLTEDLLGSRVPNLNDEIPYWLWLADGKGKNAAPFLVKVYVTPGEVSLLDRVQEYVNQHPFFTLIIEAPIPELASNVSAGAELSVSGEMGTLGGFLTDQSTGKSYGVTCGHVAKNPHDSVTFTDIGGSTYVDGGQTTHSNFSEFVTTSHNGVCRPGGNPEVDIALIELDISLTPNQSITSVGSVDTIFNRAQIGGSGRKLCMKGALSMREYEVQGFGVTQKVSSGNDNYCFSNIFDFTPLKYNNRFQRAIAALPSNGDSGSWVLIKHSSCYAFAGLFFAVEGGRAIAAFTDSVINWGSKQHLNLDI